MKRTLLVILLIISTMLLYAETVTYSVTNRTAVTATGAEPANGEVLLSMTSTSGKYSQITGGNSITLTLHNWTGAKLNSITLSMRSNKSAGAGTITVTRGNTTVYTKTGSFPELTGSAYTTEFVNATLPITPFKVGAQEDVRITVSGTENSLYWESTTLNYTAAPATCYTVHFKTNTPYCSVPSLTERAEGQGVTLPDVPYSGDNNSWSFVGWTEQPYTELATAPNYYHADEVYYPTNNTTLYALYVERGSATSHYQLTDFAIGTTAVCYIAYRIGDDGYIAASFDYNQHRIGSALCPVLYDEQAEQYFLPQHLQPSEAKAYTITFLTSDQLTIQTDDRMVGYSVTDRMLLNETSVWKYRVLKRNTLHIYFISGNDTCSLRPTFTMGATPELVWKVRIAASSNEGNILLKKSSGTMVSTYTSYPEGEPYDAVEQANTLNINITNNRIQNPLHEELFVYTVMGTLVCHSWEDINLTGWHTGAYIVRSNAGNGKVFIHK